MSKSSSLSPDILAIATFWGSTSDSRESLATRNSATASKGSIVALMPILCTSEETTESINAILRDRWVPLLVGTSECISSIMNHFI